MKYVKFSASNATPDVLVEQSTNTENGLTNNAAVFADPDLKPSELKTLREDVTKAKADQSTAFLAYAAASKVLATKTGLLGDGLTQTANYVDGVAMKDPDNGNTIANQGGFAARHAAVHSHETPPAVHGLAVTQGDDSGEADIHFDPIKGFGKILYKIFYSLDTVNFHWVLADSFDISSGKLKGLPVHANIAFRIIGHNTNGDGAPCEPVIKSLM